MNLPCAIGTVSVEPPSDWLEVNRTDDASEGEALACTRKGDGLSTLLPILARN
jgi:hypothetical protein